jgi:hypothetical protein
MMRYGIPFYRLPEDVVDKEIRQVLDVWESGLKQTRSWGGISPWRI